MIRSPRHLDLNRRALCGISAFGLAGILFPLSDPIGAASAGPLERFFSEVRTLHATFRQTVLTDDLKPIDEIEGELWLSRPGRFRWNYGNPLEQVVMADGEHLWVYDPGLEQAVVRDQAEALGDTPAGLLAGNADLNRSYLVERLGDQGGIYWVSLFPRDANAAFSQIQFGFELDTLRLVQMLDPLDQITRIRFAGVKMNMEFAAEQFRLSLPKGTDVIREDHQ